MNSPRLCIDCLHCAVRHTKNHATLKEDTMYYCGAEQAKHYNVESLVTGPPEVDARQCSHMRAGICGPNASLWVQG
jgi:hypothetical protein